MNNEIEITEINIEPSDNLFRELGNNTYDFNDLVSEFIDNSIAASNEDEKIIINIEIGLSKEKEENSYFLISDNAKGISEEVLGRALSPGGTSGGKTLNEHGLGMKQAIAALGELEYLQTKTIESDKAIIINELKFGKIKAHKKNVPWKCGTEIKVKRITSIVPTTAQKYTSSVRGYLGARYRRYLREEKPRMELKILLKNIDIKEKDGKCKVIGEWGIKEINPVYFHVNTRRNEPMIHKKTLKGRGWKAELTFGFAPTEKQYEDLGLEPPKNYEPYKVSISKQGFDIINNDRVIKFHQLSDIGLVTTRHSKFNYIRGEIDLISGFTTAITKNSIIIDSNFTELIHMVKEGLEVKGYLSKKSYPDEIPEVLLRDRLENYFKTSKLFKKSDIKKEYPIEGLGGFIDILADGEVWEIKVNEAIGLDVYQLFAYMDMGGFDKGYLVAKSFKTGAQSAAQFIETNHNKKIELIHRSEFPINDPPTDKEVELYY
ncbi:ATP-binding protein [Clostridium botulinum]|uniref:ATP-binding protein n=1 Tax=Clostridium botulinum TaxID=1491 RepID=UPI0007739BFF|nr:ATP-binding protein [Clostridium botulinum]NFE96384.1 ATP-binding protein [Clostridium botulinum]NFL39886.1 ATP-binding protein [Clostridium botulinum]NFL66909.1 ATP-binding protein [Clostridium botulinum]NFN09762.1 ATP-binding protein [Clostridium botulinum]NFN26480.1 ATP-binding protein [Clostridium botulinum]